MGMLLRRLEAVNEPFENKVKVDNTKDTEASEKATKSKPKAQKRSKK